MPDPVTHPGVFVEEAAGGVRAITGVATSITAFVGRAARGPTDVPVEIVSFAEFERVFGGLTNLSALGFAVRDFFRNGGSKAVIVRLYRAEEGAGALPAKAVLPADTLLLEAAEAGAWGNALQARVDHAARESGANSASLFNLYVRDGTTGVVEEFRDVVVDPADHPRLVSRVLRDESRLVRATAMGDARPAETGGALDPGNSVWDENASGTNHSVTEPASDGEALVGDSFNGTGLEAARQGIYALESADLVNLLVIPPYNDDGTIDTGVATSAAQYCERRRAVLLLDGPPDWGDAGDVEAAAAAGFDAEVGTVSRNAALFFPRLRQGNPLHDNQVETFAAAGAVAGVIARTDAQQGVWKAPAGVGAALDGAAELAVRLTDADIGRLNPLGVNCLRAVPGVGSVVWGARTMQGADRLASEWKYIPVRRTALFIEESLVRGTEWAVVEPNDETLWGQIRMHVGTFLQDLYRQGAFRGATPREAYFVKCDRETTTRADINSGVLNVLVGFAPSKPAEFVVIRLQQMAGQSE